MSIPTTNYIIDRFEPRFALGIHGWNVDQFVKYDVPGRAGVTYRLNSLNWPGFIEAIATDPQPSPQGEARRIMEALFAAQHSIDTSVLKKYENTLQFVDYAIRFMRPSKKTGGRSR